PERLTLRGGDPDDAYSKRKRDLPGADGAAERPSDLCPRLSGCRAPDPVAAWLSRQPSPVRSAGPPPDPDPRGRDLRLPGLGPLRQARLVPSDRPQPTARARDRHRPARAGGPRPGRPRRFGPARDRLGAAPPRPRGRARAAEHLLPVDPEPATPR